VAWLGRQGVSVQRVMTDNGSAYRYGLFRKALAIGPWTHGYNLAKPHARLKGRTPLQSVNNLRVNDDEAVARNPRGVFWDVTYERADERTRSPEIPQ
jgi:hypothetical protein